MSGCLGAAAVRGLTWSCETTAACTRPGSTPLARQASQARPGQVGFAIRPKSTEDWPQGPQGGFGLIMPPSGRCQVAWLKRPSLRSGSCEWEVSPGASATPRWRPLPTRRDRTARGCGDGDKLRWPGAGSPRGAGPGGHGARHVAHALRLRWREAAWRCPIALPRPLGRRAPWPCSRTGRCASARPPAGGPASAGPSRRLTWSLAGDKVHLISPLEEDTLKGRHCRGIRSRSSCENLDSLFSHEERVPVDRTEPSSNWQLNRVPVIAKQHANAGARADQITCKRLHEGSIPKKTPYTTAR